MFDVGRGQKRKMLTFQRLTYVTKLDSLLQNMPVAYMFYLRVWFSGKEVCDLEEIQLNHLLKLGILRMICKTHSKGVSAVEKRWV